jgi:hypothetical protein
MNDLQRQEHGTMLRQYMGSLNRRHMITETASRVEWLSIKRRVTSSQYVIGSLLAFGVLGFVATKRDVWELSATLSALSALGLYYGIAAYKQPLTQTIVICDREAQTLSAPLAGLEIDLRHLTHLGVRGLRPKPRRTIRLDHHHFWLGVYAFVEGEPHLLYLGEEEAREMALRLATALSVPLMEPGPDHAPTRF